MVRGLETAIAALENDIRVFVQATGESFPEANRRMGLINMGPEKLCEFWRAYGKDWFPSYDHIKMEIVDWLVDEARRGNLFGGRAAALGAANAAET